jgi:hypothetical protein
MIVLARPKLYYKVYIHAPFQGLNFMYLFFNTFYIIPRYIQVV